MLHFESQEALHSTAFESAELVELTLADFAVVAPAAAPTGQCY